MPKKITKTKQTAKEPTDAQAIEMLMYILKNPQFAEFLVKNKTLTAEDANEMVQAVKEIKDKKN